MCYIDRNVFVDAWSNIYDIKVYLIKKITYTDVMSKSLPSLQQQEDVARQQQQCGNACTFYGV